MNVNKLSALLVLIFIVAVGATVNYNPPSGPGNFKNLKILPKDISKDSLDKVMDQFRDALGVKCNFCHAMSKDTLPKRHMDFASDEKDEKNTARFMMQMTLDINAKYFTDPTAPKTEMANVVTCITCHRGIASPDAEGIAKQMQLMPKLQQAPPPQVPAPGHKE